jgi:ribosome-binding factor A
LADPALNDLLVADVRPFPDWSRLLVTLRSATNTPVDRSAVLDRIQRAASILRREVAAAINRRKTPDLIYQVDQGLL